MTFRQIAYDDLEALQQLLVGQTITKITKRTEIVDGHWGEELDHILFNLSGGAVLEAIETDGGCACSNGCWSVATEAAVGATIMSVCLEEVDPDSGKPIRPDYDDSAIIRLFVMTDAGRQNLVVSEGCDNGYYGWGFHLRVHASEAGDAL